MNHPFTPSRIQSIRRKLLSWYRSHARDLPWRRTSDPYSIWLSEIMLQQTRVETVIHYYQRFLQAFPTVRDLANAPEDRVLKLWEGLGYYSRARNLHKAAAIVAHEREGHFPATLDDWMALPGIGRYTAAAIGSIAFRIPAAVLDGNVKRVLARLANIEDEIDRSATLSHLWHLAETLLAKRSPGDFNQAMMELGARVCLPRKPQCNQCPLQSCCLGYAGGHPELLPRKRSRKQVPHVHVVAGAIRKNGRYLLGKRPPDGMLGGLWEFPGGKVQQGETHVEALARELREELDIQVDVRDHVATVDHVYSHLRVSLHLYLCTHTSGKPACLYHSQLKWVPRSHFERYAFPKANLKFLHLL